MRASLYFSILCAVAAYITGPIVDPDLWWHITSGRWIVAHGALPHVDQWNMFGAGQPWRPYSWWCEILFAVVEARYGAYGLLILQFVVAVLLAAALAWLYSSLSRDRAIGLILGIFATLSTYNHFTLRPQAFVWIYLALLILIVDRIAERGHLTRASGVALLICMALWANTHISTALGLAVIAGWLWSASRRKLTLQTVALGLFGTLITPHFGAEWLTFFRKSGHPFALNAIAEFHPATIMQPSTAFLVLALALVAAFGASAVPFSSALSSPSLTCQPRQPLARYLLLAAFSLAGLAVVKFLPLAVIVALALLAKQWAALHSEGAVRSSAISPARGALQNLIDGVERLRRGILWLPSAGVSFVALAITIVSLHNVWQEPVSLKIVPVQAFDFLMQRKLPLPVLVGFGQGGYLMYRFSDARGELPTPQHRAPIDGRTNVVPHHIWESSLKSFRGERGWRDYLDNVQPQTILWRTESPLTSILENNQEWCLIYRSGSTENGFSIYIKHELFVARKPEFSSDNCR